MRVTGSCAEYRRALLNFRPRQVYDTFLRVVHHGTLRATILKRG